MDRALVRAPVWHGGGTRQGHRWWGSPEWGGDAEAKEELRSGSAPTVTVAFGGRQRPEEDPITPCE
jgi:hypothetical protein